MWKRWATVGAVAVFGFVQAGPMGIFYALFIFGFFCFLFYTLQDGLHAVTGFMHRPVVYVEKDGQTIKGHPDVEGSARRTNPDPTRPDTDDFMGLITYKVEKKYRG